MSYLGVDPGSLLTSAEEAEEKELYVRTYEEDRDDYVFAEVDDEELIDDPDEDEDDGVDRDWLDENEEEADEEEDLDQEYDDLEDEDEPEPRDFEVAEDLED